MGSSYILPPGYQPDRAAWVFVTRSHEIMAASIIHIQRHLEAIPAPQPPPSKQTYFAVVHSARPPARARAMSRLIDYWTTPLVRSFDGRQRKEEWYEIIDHALASKERKKIEISTYQDQESSSLLRAFCLACPATGIGRSILARHYHHHPLPLPLPPPRFVGSPKWIMEPGSLSSSSAPSDVRRPLIRSTLDGHTPFRWTDGRMANSADDRTMAATGSAIGRARASDYRTMERQ